MQNIIQLFNYLEKSNSQRKLKNRKTVKSRLEKYSDILIMIGLGLFFLTFIMGFIYKFIYSPEILKTCAKSIIVVAELCFILSLLIQLIPALIFIKNFRNESQKLFFKYVEHNEEAVKVLSKYDKDTLLDGKEHIQIKINSNTSKNNLFIGKNVTIIFLLGLIYSSESNKLDLITIFSQIFSYNYHFGNLLTLILFSLALGIYLGGYSLLLENRRLSQYIDLINMAIKRKERNR